MEVNPDLLPTGEEEGARAEVLELTVGEEEAGQRLDQLLATRLEPSRSRVQAWIEQGYVLLDGAPAKSSARLRAGQQILVEVPPPVPAEPQPEADIPLDILYEDPDLVVLNKQRGLAIHPGAAATSGTLVNALLAHIKDLSGVGGVLRPGIVHRLDKNTSGVMVVAKSDRAHVGLQNQFRERTMLKIYEAVVHGVPWPRQGRIEQPLGRHPAHRHKMAVVPGGRPSRTDYRVVEEFGSDYSRLRIQLHTGRTHQIRVHMAWLGHPVLGDNVYGRRSNPFGLVGQFLHCRQLGFVHPVTGSLLEFEAPLPPELAAVLEELRALP